MRQGHREDLRLAGRVLVMILIVAIPCIVYLLSKLAALIISVDGLFIMRKISYEEIESALGIDERAVGVTYYTVVVMLGLFMICSVYHLIAG